MHMLRWLTALFVVFLMIVITVASLGYSLDFVNRIPYGDKLGHLVLMGLLSLLVNLGLNAKTFNLGSITLLKGSAVVLIAVTVEECSQIFFVHRHFDLADLAADYFGILLFGKLATWYVTKRCVTADI